MIQQELTVIPHGIIQSGSVLFKINESNGLIDFSDTFVVGWSIFTQTLRNQKTFKIDPSHLLSANIHLGLTMSIAALKLEVVSIDNEMATLACSYKDDDNQFTGEATLDLAGQYFRLTHVEVSGVSNNSNVTLELVA